MTSVYFAALASSGQIHAMSVSLIVVIGISALCLGAVWLLPRKAAKEPL